MRFLRGMFTLVIVLVAITGRPAYAEYNVCKEHVLTAPGNPTEMEWNQCMQSCTLWLISKSVGTIGCMIGVCKDRCNAAMQEGACAGDPIDLYTGNNIQTEIDYRSNTKAPLEIVRHYNSSNLMPSGNFGKNWSGLGTKTIKTRRYGTGSSAYDIYTVTGENGQTARFFYNGTNFYPESPSTTLTLNFNGIEWSLKTTDGVVEKYPFDFTVYNATGAHTALLASATFPEGITHTYLYDSNSRIQSITHNQSQQQLSFTYYSNTARIHTITAPGGRVFSYEYDLSENLTKVFYPSNTGSPFRQYHYDDPNFSHALTSLTDENGDLYATWTYDSTSGRAISSYNGTETDAAGKVDIEYDTGSTIVTNGAGQQTIYRFDNVIFNGANALEAGGKVRLKEVEGSPTSNCLGGTKSIAYDPDTGFVDTVTDRRGTITNYDHNAKNQETTRTEAFGKEEARTINTTWHPTLTHLKTDVEIVGNHKTHFEYFDNGLVHTKTETDLTNFTVPYSTNGRTRTWTYEYTYHDEEQTSVSSITINGPRDDVNDISVMRFNSSGLLTSASRHVSSDLVLETSITEHTSDGLPKVIVDENGVVTTLTYTPRGWLESRSVATTMGNIVTSYQYDNVGQVERTSMPNGVALNYEYDAAHRLKKIYTDDNERIEFDLDSFGNHKVERVISSSEVVRKLTKVEFDDLGRLWKRIGIEGQELQKNGYDENGNLTTITNNKLVGIVNAFDALNRIKSKTERDTGFVEYKYDVQNNLTSVIDQKGLTTAYVIDGFGRRIQESSPDRGVIVYRYDLADNLTKVTDARSVVTDYTYDALNRIKTVTYPTSSADNTTYFYDEINTDGVTNKGKGFITSATGANGNSTKWVYNDLGRITRDVRIIGTQTYRTKYDYDTASNLKNVTYPSGREVEYQPDTKNRIGLVRTRKSASDSWINLASNIAYEPFGPIKSFTYGNGLTENLTFDQHYQPDLMQTLNGGSSVQNIDYGFNLNNELETVLDNKNSARSQTLGYDEVGRLNNAQGQYGTLSIGYDFVGNRLSQTRGGAPDSNNFVETYELPLDSHRLSKITTTGTGGQSKSFAYSNAGNITGDGTFTYVYGATNRLNSVMNGPAVVAEYTYNSFGQRLIKKVGAETIHFVYGLESQLLAELKGDGTPIRDYIYLGDRVLAMIDVEGASTPTIDLKVSLAGNNGKAVKQADGSFFVTYEVTVLNQGSATAENVTLANTFPSPGTTLSNYVATQGTCNGDGLSCSLGAISGGQTVKVTITTREDEKTSEEYTSTVSTISNDIDAANNTTKAKFGGSLAVWFFGVMATLLAFRAWHAHAKAQGTAPILPVLFLGLAMVGMTAPTTSQADQIYYMHTDHLNTPTVVTNQSKTVVWEGVKRPFGETQETVATIRQPLRFPGQYHDNETGLDHNGFRDYDSNLGRYIQSDPIGLTGGINTYAYVGTNPLRGIDPSGLATLEIPLPDIPGVPDWVKVGGANWLALIGTVLSLSGDTPRSKCEKFYRGDLAGKTEFWAPFFEQGGTIEGALALINSQGFSGLASSHASGSIGSPYISITTNPLTAQLYAGSNGQVYLIALPPGMAVQNTYNQNAVWDSSTNSAISDDEWLVPIHIPSQYVNNSSCTCE